MPAQRLSWGGAEGHTFFSPAPGCAGAPGSSLHPGYGTCWRSAGRKARTHPARAHSKDGVLGPAPPPPPVGTATAPLPGLEHLALPWEHRAFQVTPTLLPHPPTWDRDISAPWPSEPWACRALDAVLDTVHSLSGPRTHTYTRQCSPGQDVPTNAQGFAGYQR